MKFDQGHQNSRITVKFNGGYPEAKLERSRLQSLQEGPKVSLLPYVHVEFVKSNLP